MKKIISLFVVLVIISVAIYFTNFSNGANNAPTSTINVDQIPSQFTDKNIQEALAPNDYINGYVNKVTDGDTIQVTYNGEIYKVRLLDIDTPESVKSGVPVQQYSKEASAFTKQMTLYKKVKLFFEKGLRDKYQRLLAHIILDNGKYLNALLVRNGYARVEVLSPNTKYLAYFNQLQDKAVTEKVGLWGLKENEIPFVWSNRGYYIPRYWADQSAA